MSVRAVSFGGSAAVAALLATTAFPATVLLDFESEAQRAQMPTRCNGRMEVGCAQTGAADGSWGFALKPSPWKQGMPEWPSVNLPVARTDRTSPATREGGSSIARTRPRQTAA